MSNTVPDALKGFYRGKTVLVVGAAGFLGTNIVRLLAGTEARVVRLARKLPSLEKVVGSATIKDCQGDVRDKSLWNDLLDGVDILIYLAAQTSAYAANDDPHDDLELNVRPMIHLLEACRAQKRKPFIIFASTVTVVGIPKALPVNEDHPENPLTIYDLDKFTGENYLKYYVGHGDASGTVLRMSNVYGPGPASSRPDRGILNKMIARALAGEPLTVYGKGEFLRDYMHVTDVARAFLHAGAARDALDGKHSIIGSGTGHTVAEAMHLVADGVATHTGKKVEVRHIEPPSPQSPIENRNFIGDPRRFILATGWRLEYSLKTGLDQTIKTHL